MGEGEVGGGIAYNGLYQEVPPEKRAFLRLQLYLRVEISQVEVVEVYKMVNRSITTSTRT